MFPLMAELLFQNLINFSNSSPATVGGNVIVNTVAGIPQSPFQANKRLASPVIPGTLSVSRVLIAAVQGSVFFSIYRTNLTSHRP